MINTLQFKTLQLWIALLALATVALAQPPAAGQPASGQQSATPASSTAAAVPTIIPGFRNSAAEHTLEQKFLAVPSPELARQHLRILTAVPHIAGSPEDRQTADYVAAKFREAGLQVRIDAYKVWMNLPHEILVEATAPAGLVMRGPTREHVEGDPYQDDPRVVTPFNAGSPSGEVEAELVYANYGRPEDFRLLKQMGIDVRGKIVIARYGQNFRGVKALAAQQSGAAALIIYSDPMDDGYFRGDPYPAGPYRPPTGVQRGSVQFTFEYPGDATTPGIASTLDLPLAQRVAPQDAASLPKIPVTPLSYADASPLLEKLDGQETPREWQGALPFTYHMGPGPVRVHLKLVQDYSYTTIWNVIGTIPGASQPNQLVIAGNHRDAWVFGAVDPSSGTAAMLEAVHGIGELLGSGWRPQRTIVFASWDAEEQGLIGSTEYTEQYAKPLQDAVAYFNIDVGVAGPEFGASCVPSLKGFLLDIARSTPSPAGGTVYDEWRVQNLHHRNERADAGSFTARPAEISSGEVHTGDLGSGSDYSGFLQHLGVPATDIGSSGPYGVYHSAFDDFAWFTRFADPNFAYTQQMARVFGLEVLRMAQADALPFDYEAYGDEVGQHLQRAQRRAQELGWAMPASAPRQGTKPDARLDFAAAIRAAAHLSAAGRAVHQAAATVPAAQLPGINTALEHAERAMLGNGLPHRPWFRHLIYAPGEYTGYAAVVLPGVNEAMDRNDRPGAIQALDEVSAALERAARVLESGI